MRRSYSGGAQPARLTIALGGSISDLAIYCDDLTNWPDGSGGTPFYVVIDRGNGSEEKILCSARSGNTLTVWNSGLNTGRAADDTPVTSHSVNAVVEHCFTATDADEANAHVNASAQVHGLSGTVVGTTDTQTLTNKTLTDPVIAGGAADFDNLQIAGVNPVTVSATQTLTNKTLTSPTITGPVITGGTANNFPPIGTIVAWAGANPPIDGDWLLCNGQAVSTTTYSTLYGVCGSTYDTSGGQAAPSPGTFRVPNLSGRVPVGVGDNDFGARGVASGSKTSTAPHTHGIDHDHPSFNAASGWQSASHSHTVSISHDHGSFDTTTTGSHQHTYAHQLSRLEYGGGGKEAAYSGYMENTGAAGAHSHSIDVPNFSGDSGSVGNQSADHTHTTAVDVPAFTGTSGASSAAVAAIGNAQPYVVVNYIIKAL